MDIVKCIFIDFRYPNIVDDTTTPVLEQWLSQDKNGQGINSCKIHDPEGQDINS